MCIKFRCFIEVLGCLNQGLCFRCFRSMAMEIDGEERRWEHIDKVLARHGPLENEDFPGDEEVSQ